MFDIKLIREDVERVRKLVSTKKDNSTDLDRILELDTKRRDITFQVENLKSKQNMVSKEIPRLKKEGKDVSSVLQEMKDLSDKIKEDDKVLSEIESELKDLLLRVPNLPHESVPIGDSDEDNVEVRKWGDVKDFSFEPKAHWDIGEKLNILDPTRAAKVTGSRFKIGRASCRERV